MVLPTTGTLSFSQINQAVRFTNGNVGINTTAPGYLLDINGTANATNIISTSTSTGSLNASDITTGNLNLTGALYQNGAAYVASQWTGSVGSTLSYTSGNVVASNASFTNATISNLRLINSNMNYTNVTMSNLIAENVNLGMSSMFSGSFVASNNVSSPTAVTSLIFPSDLIRSFKISVSVTILVSSGSNLYTLYNILGNQTDSGWTLFIDNLGDESGITFTINSSGQLFYTSTNVSNFTSSTFRYSAEQFTASGSYASLSSVTQGTYLLDTIQINNTTDTLSGVSNGGLYVLGGATITKGLRVSGDISTGALQAPNGITTGNINFTGTLYQNGVAYVGSQWSGSAGSAVTYTSGNVVVDNLQSTNSSLGTINSTGLTTGNINFTGTLYQNGVAYVGSQWTGAVGSAVTYTSGNVVVSNLQSTNSSLGSINSTGLTTGALLATTSVSSGSLSATNIIGSVISAGTLIGTTITGANLSLSGDLIIGGTLTSVNITTNNLTDTNISAGLLNASSITTGSLLATTSISSASVNATDVTATNIVATAASTGSLNVSNVVSTNSSVGTINATNVTASNLVATTASAGSLNVTNVLSTNSSVGTINATGVTAGNINFTGALYQNGVAYSANAAAVANIITRYQTSGVVVASSGNTIVTFDTANNTYSVGATGITYSAGTFTNSNSSTVTMSVVYTVVFPYNNTGTRAAWVQDNNGVVSGYTDTQSVISNSGYTTLTATSIITLASNGTFVIYAQSPGTALTTITGLGGSSIQVQTLNGGYAATQTNILARYLDNSQSISNNSNTVVLYDTTDSTNNIGSLPLSYSAGTFTNTGSSPISIDITYTISYNAATANAAVYEGWISSSSQNYGYTSQSTTWPASLTGSAQITIAVNGTFTITTYQNSGSTQTLNSGNRYTSIQISALTAGASGGTISATTTSNTLGSLFTTTSGNIGIGTTSPSSALQVNGAVVATNVIGSVISAGTLVCTTINATGLSSLQNINANSIRLDSASVTDDMTDAGNLTQTYIAFGPAGATTDYAYLRQIGGSNSYKMALDIHDDGDEPGFCIRSVQSTTSPDTVNECFTVQASGNVGIGITNPSANLDVNGTGRFTGTLNVSGNISSASTISGNVFTGGSLQISGSTSTGTLVASTIVLGNTSVQNTTGNININFKLKNVSGTTSATTPNLQFYQNSMLIESSNLDASGLWSNAGRSIHYGSDITIKSGDVIDVANNGDGVVDLYGGNVIIQAGIGNSNSRTGGGGSTGARGYNGKISFKVGEGILSSGSLATTEVMAILAGGNVGIGISTPSYKLDVNGAGRFTGTLLATNNSNTLGSLITTGGNVGVGTTSPAYTLDVNGTGRFTRLANDEAAAVGYVLGSSQSMPGSSTYTISLTGNNDSSVTTTYGSSVFGLSSGTNITNTSGRIITVIVNYNLRIGTNINYNIKIILSTSGTEYAIMNPQGIGLANICGSAIITMPVGSHISFGGYNYSGTTNINAGSNFQVALLN